MKAGTSSRSRKLRRTLCRTAGITGLRIHDLRHSFASQLASAGASLPLIGALLGHSNPTTTARYTHLFDDPQRAAVEKVGAIIAAAAGEGAGAEVKTSRKRNRERVMAKLDFIPDAVEPLDRANAGDYRLLARRIKDGSASQQERDLAADLIRKLPKPVAKSSAAIRHVCTQSENLGVYRRVFGRFRSKRSAGEKIFGAGSSRGKIRAEQKDDQGNLRQHVCSHAMAEKLANGPRDA